MEIINKISETINISKHVDNIVIIELVKLFDNDLELGKSIRYYVDYCQQQVIEQNEITTNSETNKIK